MALKGFKGLIPGYKSQLFDAPWRNVQWEGETNFQYVKNFKPRSGAQHLRVLLVGPPGSGKSSFINSIDSALRGRIANRAPTDTNNLFSCTQEYRSYTIEREPGTYYPLVFSDTMGIENALMSGADVENIKLIMEGHIKDGFKLLPGSDPKGSHYNEVPTINDKVHVLAYVVRADAGDLMLDESVYKMKQIREAARDLRIPQIAILPKVDNACPKVKRNIRNVYKSKHLRTKVEELNAILGIPMNCIFLVQNYTDETETGHEIDALILSAAKKIIDYGEDFLNDILPTINTNLIVPYGHKFD